MKRFVALLCLLLFMATALSEPIAVKPTDMVTISREEYERLKQFERLDEVKQYLDAEYFEDLDQQKLIDGAIQGLLSGTGDSYSFYYPEEAWKALWEQDAGKYAGIGVQMQGNPEDTTVTIIRVFPGTPAEEAGLRRGDVFHKVEDVDMTFTTMQEGVNIMRGVPGEKVHVEVRRNGEILPFEIIKDEITVPRVESRMLPQQVGYIAVYEFAGSTYKDFTVAYQQLEEQGMQALVMDLRDNGGGWVDQGTLLADLFLDATLFYSTVDGDGRREESHLRKGKTDIPLVLLVNENSASTTEIFAGAMKDHGRATLVGVKTFGKGIIQRVVQLSDGKTGFQFTTSQYFSPKGNKVHIEGVTPDIEVEMPEEFKQRLFELGDLDDPQLKAAFDEALTKIPAPAKAAGL